MTASASGQHPLFRGSFTRPVHSLCTLHVTGRPVPAQRLASSRAPPFAGQDLDLSALAERFPTPTLISSSFPFPKFLLLLGVPPFQGASLGGTVFRGCVFSERSEE